MSDAPHARVVSGIWSESRVFSRKSKVPDALLETRRKHGFKTEGRNERVSSKKWRDDMLSGKIVSDGADIPAQDETQWPKNWRILNAIQERFGFMGFRWKTQTQTRTNKKGDPLTDRFVVYENPPKVGGYALNLVDALLVPVEIVDGYSQAAGTARYQGKLGQPVAQDVEDCRARMNATGVGYKGFEGVSWRQMIDPFELPKDFMEKLGRLGRAIRMGYEAVTALYPLDSTLRSLLSCDKPNRIPPEFSGDRIGLIRPDIVIVQDPEDGQLRPVITELESCPGGQGMAHAMEVGYGLPTTMVDGYIRWLNGRKLIVFATNEWAEYVFDQACFVAALRERGVSAEIWFDKPLSSIQREVQPRSEIVEGRTVKKGWWAFEESSSSRIIWNTDFLGRLAQHGFDIFIHGSDEGIPHSLGNDTVVYRFGYFDNFINTPHSLTLMRAWRQGGACMANPLDFYLESKGLMSAFWHASVMRWIRERDPAALVDLHNGVAETHTLTGLSLACLEQESRDSWLTKIAAWDGDNKSWGSRGVEFGSQFRAEGWQRHLETCAIRGFYPTVLQRFINSRRYSVAYRDDARKIAIDHAARTRLTPFFLFHQDGSVELAGSTISLRSNTLRIHGARDTSEGPVIYVEEP